MLTKQHADKIVKKLDGRLDAKPNRPHDLINIFHNGRLVASFGLRRGSKKDASHDHIPHSLHCTPNFAMQLASCIKSQADWIELMQSKGLIER